MLGLGWGSRRAGLLDVAVQFTYQRDGRTVAVGLPEGPALVVVHPVATTGVVLQLGPIGIRPFDGGLAATKKDRRHGRRVPEGVDWVPTVLDHPDLVVELLTQEDDRDVGPPQ